MVISVPGGIFGVVFGKVVQVATPIVSANRKRRVNQRDFGLGFLPNLPILTTYNAKEPSSGLNEGPVKLTKTDPLPLTSTHTKKTKPLLGVMGYN